MVKIKIEDILFWLIILFIIGIALWLLHGSPMDSSAIIAISLAFASSEMLLWKKFFGIDKKTALGFMKLKNDINILNTNLINKLDNYNIQVNNKLDSLNNKLNKIK